MKFKIQRMTRNGIWENEMDVKSLDQAIELAIAWARHDPRCAWGVRVYDTMAETVAFRL